MMSQYKYPPVLAFDFDFNHQKILDAYHELSDKGYGNRLLAVTPEEIVRDNDEDKAKHCKNNILNLNGIILNEEPAKYIYSEVDRFCKVIGSKEYNTHLISYDDKDFVLWHFDKRPVGYGPKTTKVNIMLTGESFTSFRCGDYSYTNGLVDVTRREHMYDNRGKSYKAVLRIQIKDFNYDDLYEVISGNEDLSLQ